MATRYVQLDLPGAHDTPGFTRVRTDLGKREIRRYCFSLVILMSLLWQNDAMG